MIRCPYPSCGAENEEDAFFCDQCGEELFFCVKCGRPGKGKHCVNDGSPLKSRRESDAATAPLERTPAPLRPSPPPQQQQAPPPQQPQAPARTVRDVGESVSQTREAGPSTLTLENRVINIILEIEHEDVIGRVDGRFAAQFVPYSNVSSRHARFRMQNNAWMIEDLGSTNGTKIKRSGSSSATPLAAGKPEQLFNGDKIHIANIEFNVKIKPIVNEEKSAPKTSRMPAGPARTSRL